MHSIWFKFIAAISAFFVGVFAVAALHQPAIPPVNPATRLVAIDADNTSVSDDQRAKDNEVFKRNLESLYAEYTNIAAAPDVARLVAFDTKLRDFLKPLHEVGNNGMYFRDDNRFWRDEYAEMGLYVGHWTEMITYNGKLLAEAHRINPRSPYRELTLYSTFSNDDEYGSIPDTVAALRYIKEFPEGIFTENAMLVLADFHKDLYMVLRNELAGQERDYKFECYKSFIRGKSTVEQKANARTTAMVYYRKALALNPGNTNAREMLAKVKAETVEAWSYCSGC